MTEQCYNIRQDVFGVLGKIGKGPMEVWFLLLRIFPDGQGAVQLPSKLRKDARVLVEAGIVIEPEPGKFEPNPDVIFMTEEPSWSEIEE